MRTGDRSGRRRSGRRRSGRRRVETYRVHGEPQRADTVWVFGDADRLITVAER